MADTLSYAQDQFQPRCIVDIATLTGAVSVALGPLAAGLFTADNHLASLLQSSSDRTGELLWRMPLWDEYLEQMRSRVADFSNIGARGGGACTAASFLRQFVDISRISWAHLDIGNMMEYDKPTGCHPAGMSGFGGRLLVDFVLSSDFSKS